MAAFSNFTFYGNRPAVPFYDACHVAQSQAISFVVVDVARGYAEEFIENFALILRGYADAVVLNVELQTVLFFDDLEVNFGIRAAVFERIFNQIVKNAREVRWVSF